MMVVVAVVVVVVLLDVVVATTRVRHHFSGLSHEQLVERHPLHELLGRPRGVLRSWRWHGGALPAFTNGLARQLPKLASRPIVMIVVARWRCCYNRGKQLEVNQHGRADEYLPTTTTRNFLL